MSTGSTIIVTGSVRCGSSLVMRILSHCKIPVIQDDHKQPDEGNPHGYYEHRGVYSIQRGNYDVIQDSAGKALKIIPPTILYNLPNTTNFKTIFLIRSPEEVAKSFYNYEVLRVTAAGISRRILKTEEEYLLDYVPNHIRVVEAAKEWIKTHQNFDVLWVEHNSLMLTPLVETTRICKFLSAEFPQFQYDPHGMAELVDPALYRQRQTHSK